MLLTGNLTQAVLAEEWESCFALLDERDAVLNILESTPSSFSTGQFEDAIRQDKAFVTLLESQANEVKELLLARFTKQQGAKAYHQVSGQDPENSQAC